MAKTSLHITNGDHLTSYLNELNIPGEKLTWQEMLCEGPTLLNINSEAFFKSRAAFFSTNYNIDLDVEAFKTEIGKLDQSERYSEIILWFEYDLFCHINMIAVLNLIQQKKIDLPIFLVCSGRIPGTKNLKGLSELSPEQLIAHYHERVKLNAADMDLASTIWGIYCGKDHNLLKPFIVKSSTFKYLSNCLKAHLERFPNIKSGLNVLEKNILEIVRDNTIKSKHHLLGYALNYQGYYGFGDLQIDRIIEKLSVFFIEEETGLTLNRDGHEALLDQRNFLGKLKDDMTFGGVNVADFQFSKQQNKLVKTIINAH